MNREEIELRVAGVIGQLSNQLPPTEVEEMLSLSSAGEPGIALENLCTQVVEYDLSIPEQALEEIRELAEAMGIDEHYWRDLQTCRRT